MGMTGHPLRLNTDAGGTVMVGPHEVPDGMHIIMDAGPQRAAFVLVGGN